MDLILILYLIALSNSGGLSGLDGVEAAEARSSEPRRCSIGFQLCKDGIECVLYTNLCDGDEDCKDGSDEEDCPQGCETGQFQCAHGMKCIDESEVCDGVSHCQDHSDERDCWKPTPSCTLRCDNKTRCVPQSFICDGEEDCKDRADEANCAEVTCSSGEFRCASGRCVSEDARCDGHADCPDRSDEEGCGAAALTCPSKRQCPRSGECLLDEWVCDGEKDCGDGTDEKDCKVGRIKCGEFQWSCVSKTECVPTSWRCDGVKDCKDGSDETGCLGEQCASHQFQCGAGGCLDTRAVCNGTSDCPDGSDEGGACAPGKCSGHDAPAPPCAQNCYRTPQGMKCACSVGFRLQPDGRSCVDIDECQETLPQACGHTCLNTNGSYRCSCHPGYLLEPDAHRCKITGDPVLLAAVQHELQLFSLRNATLDVLFASGKGAVLSLDYDWREQTVFWVSRDADSIKWISLDRKRMGTMIKGVKLDCIAVDWVGRNLYWTDGVGGQILATRLNTTATDASSFTVVLDEDLEQPHSLVLLPQKGLMFWSEIGGEPQIERAGMDGSDRKVVVSKSLSWPTGLSVDPLGDRIYWTDEKAKCIGSASFDGGDVKIIQLMEMSSPFSVIVFGDDMYWSDTKRRTIQRANKNTGKNREVLLKRLGQPFGLKVVHELLQPLGRDPCAEKVCSHLCLLAPGPKAVCRCPASLLLAADGTTCAAPEGDDSFLLLLGPTAVSQIYLRGMRGAVQLQGWPEHRAVSLGRVNEPTALDLAVREGQLYLADAGPRSVGLYDLYAALEPRVEALEPRGVAVQPDGEGVAAMALDWVTLNVYWSGSERPRVRVTAAGGKRSVTLLHQGLRGPASSLAVHPPSGRLCFADPGRPGHRDQARVECAFMDGRNRTLLWERAVTPAALSFADDGALLYWADIGAGVIASIRHDGSGYVERQSGDGTIQAFTYGDGVLFWATRNVSVKRNHQTSKVWFGDGLKSKTLWFEVKTEVVSLKAYGKSSQKGSNGCSQKNGGCSHLCLAFPGGRTCRCAQDHHTVNATGCAPDCTPDSRSCRDGRGCVPLAKVCDGRPDCVDKSDEDCGSGLNSSLKTPQDAMLPPASTAGALVPATPPPARATPAGATPAGATPAGATPAKATPAKATPAKATPAGATPARATPSEVTPAGPTATGATTTLATPAPPPVEGLDARPCGEQLCHGRGACVSRGGEVTCECEAGSSGEFCQDGMFSFATLRAPLAYAGIALVATFIVGAVVLGVRRRKTNQRRARTAAKETTLMDMDKRTEASSTQNGQKDTCDPTEE